MDMEEDLILKQDVLGRVTIPKEKREELVDAFEVSGMSGKSFAAHHGINYQTFANWVQKRRRARGDYDDEAMRRKLRMGTKKPTAKKMLSKSSVELNFIEAELSSSPDNPLPQALEVLLPGGVVVKVTSESQLPLLKSLLHKLSC